MTATNIKTTPLDDQEIKAGYKKTKWDGFLRSGKLYLKTVRTG